MSRGEARSRSYPGSADCSAGMLFWEFAKVKWLRRPKTEKGAWGPPAPLAQPAVSVYEYEGSLYIERMERRVLLRPPSRMTYLF